MVYDDMNGMKKAISIIIIDDHPLFRQGVVDALYIQDDFLVVAESADGIEGLRLIRGIRPMVAIVDVNLPGLNGLQLTNQLKLEKIATRILLLTAYDDSEQKIHAMQVGASGYLTKDISPETLIDDIIAVTDGKYIVGEDVFDRRGISEWLDTKTDLALRNYSIPGDPYQPLSEREMQILVHVAHGFSNKEIASNLKISHQTVKNHVTAVLRKLGVNDRTQAAIFAIRRGWVRIYETNTELTE